MLKAAIASLLCASAVAAHAQVTVNVSLTPPIVPFHRQAAFTITVESPAGVEVQLPDMRDHFGDLAVYGLPDFQAVPLGGDRIRTTETYILDPVYVRDHVIPPVVVTWGGGNEVAVPSPMFRVRELTPEELEQAQYFEGQIAGGPGEGSPAPRAYLPWLIVLAVAAAASVAAFLFLRRRGIVRPGGPAPVAPWEVARERLAALAERHLPQQGNYDAYHVDLSAILRYYIEGRFHVHAPERTTPEFLSEISGKGYFSPEQEVFLARFLRLCDRVKFAQFRPDLEAMAVSIEEVGHFVDQTIPVEEPEEEAVAA